MNVGYIYPKGLTKPLLPSDSKEGNETYMKAK